MSVIKKETIDVRRVGTVLIGGDFTGNARGARSIDIQTERTAATQIATPDDSITIGQRNTVSSTYGSKVIAIGYNNSVSAYSGECVAIGIDNVQSSYATETVTIGKNNSAAGLRTIAIGHDNIAGTNAHDYAIAIGHNNDALELGAVALGSNNTTSGQYASILGNNNTASAYKASAIGSNCTASGLYSAAIGYESTASASYSTAIGYQAKARIQKTVNLGGVIIQRKDDGEAASVAFESFCGVEVILMSKEVDMKVVADHTITLPANCKFWLNEIGIIARTIADLVAQPTVRYGITGDLDKHNAAAITTDLTAADKREIEAPLVPEDGETSLTGGITIAADATTFTGRFYWKGMLVEDE